MKNRKIIKTLILLSTVVVNTEPYALNYISYPACRTCFSAGPGGKGYKQYCIQVIDCISFFTLGASEPRLTSLVDNAQEKKVSTGISYNLEVLPKISKINPWVALLLRDVHQDHRIPEINLLHGLTAFNRIHTAESVQRIIDGETDEAAINALTQPTPENRFVQVRWAGQEIPGQKLLVTFVTEMINETAEKRSGHIAPSIEVEFSTTRPYTLVKWRAIK